MLLDATLLRADGSEFTARYYGEGKKKTELKNEGKATDAVDELIVKIGKAPTKKFRVIERDSCHEER